MTRPSITFTVHGKAIAKGSMRAFQPKGMSRPVLTSTAKGLKAWESDIRGELQSAMKLNHPDIVRALFDAPIAVGLRFHMMRPKKPKNKHYPTTKPDIDKLARAAVDALSSVLFRDDAQVVALEVRKVYAEAGAKVDITVEGWGERTLLA